MPTEKALAGEVGAEGQARIRTRGRDASQRDGLCGAGKGAYVYFLLVPACFACECLWALAGYTVSDSLGDLIPLCLFRANRSDSI